MADVEAIAKLVNQLSKLPGIGRKTAQRLESEQMAQGSTSVKFPHTGQKCTCFLPLKMDTASSRI